MKALNIWAFIRIALVLAVLITFAIIPTQAIANTSFCILYLITGQICPGCGSSRALNNIMHLDFTKAFLYNPILTLFVFPVIVIVLVNDLYCLIYRIIKKKPKYSFLEYLVLGLREV